ncbi:Reverse transcriptase [Phytophthora palmivora]|uniref:Reverse transcriptase n=1 Tax=Phytophthora palmivora TaxID=4796 RepID=A0A2P4YIL3_9STRA|nr:Reverse transcriptase [Phytophthora palmivora]
MVDRPSYPAPRAILKRPEISQIQVKPVLTTEDQPSAGIDPQDRTPIQPVGTEVTSQDVDHVRVGQKVEGLDPVIGGLAERNPPGQLSVPIQEASSGNPNDSTDPEPDTEIHNWTPIQSVGTEVTNQNLDQVQADDLDPVIGGSAERDLPGQLSVPTQEASPEDRNNSPDPEPDPEVHYHEGNDLYAENVEQEMAILPEINSTTDEVKIEDIQVGDPGIQTTAEIERLRQRIWKYRPEINSTTDEVKIEDIQVGDPGIQTTAEIERLRQRIWKHRHLLIGKGNALPPAARGVVCDIDVGDARPIAQRVRKIAPRFREKLSDLIKGLLSAKMISYSRSPWASPIVVIVKKNGVDIKLCIDYRLVNSLTQLMVYHMPLTNDLLEDLDKVLWYCSLDMASGFWVVTMTDRARAISAFITPFGLFEWNRMPFGLKNAPQIYQRLIDNALYGFTRIPPPGSDPRSTDVFEVGEADDPDKPSVIGRSIDDIIIPAGSWDQLCDRVDALLEARDKWNLSISVVKSFWGMGKVE